MGDGQRGQRHGWLRAFAHPSNTRPIPRPVYAPLRPTRDSPRTVIAWRVGHRLLPSRSPSLGQTRSCSRRTLCSSQEQRVAVVVFNSALPHEQSPGDTWTPTNLLCIAVPRGTPSYRAKHECNALHGYPTMAAAEYLLPHRRNSILLATDLHPVVAKDVIFSVGRLYGRQCRVQITSTRRREVNAFDVVVPVSSPA